MIDPNRVAEASESTQLGTISAVAERTRSCRMRIWGFGVGGALSGMIRAGRRLGRAEWVEMAASLVEAALDAGPDPTDHLISVETLLALSEVRPEWDVGGACSRWAAAVLHARRPAPAGPRVHRPDLPVWSSTIWVDCMHTDGPGLAALGMRDEAVSAAGEYAAVLQRDDGLFHHGYDVASGHGNGVAWGRGQAWALLGLVGTLRAADDAGLRYRLERLVEAIALHEDLGRWRTVIDEPDAPIEHSVAAYVAYGVSRGIAHGLVDESHAPMVERAYESTLQSLVSGGLPVSEATPVGDSENYRSRDLGVFPWGQAPVLHAMLDRLDGKAAS